MNVNPLAAQWEASGEMHVFTTRHNYLKQEKEDQLFNFLSVASTNWHRLKTYYYEVLKL